MLSVGSKDNVKDFVLATIRAALEFRMSVCNKFQQIAVFVRNVFLCSNSLMFMFLFFLLNDFDVVLAAIAALEVTMLVCLYIRNKFNKIGLL